MIRTNTKKGVLDEVRTALDSEKEVMILYRDKRKIIVRNRAMTHAERQKKYYDRHLAKQ